MSPIEQGHAPTRSDSSSGEVRASDRERDSVVERLRRHAAEGRLTLDELEQRTEAAYRARTRRELAHLTGDLPSEDERPAPARRSRPRLSDHVRAYLLVNLLLVAIWAATGGPFWPLWPILGWGLGLAMHGRGGGACRRSRSRERPDASGPATRVA